METLKHYIVECTLEELKLRKARVGIELNYDVFIVESSPDNVHKIKTCAPIDYFSGLNARECTY
jgi:hypothetical protein